MRFSLTLLSVEKTNILLAYHILLANISLRLGVNVKLSLYYWFKIFLLLLSKLNCFVNDVLKLQYDLEESF